MTTAEKALARLTSVISEPVVCRKSDDDPKFDWYVIERAEHDGRTWTEKVSDNAYALRTSARISDADVEGPAAQMVSLAQAIVGRVRVEHKRCAVDARGDGPVKFWSPRNSQEHAEVTREVADNLAKQIFDLAGVP